MSLKIMINSPSRMNSQMINTTSRGLTLSLKIMIHSPSRINSQMINTTSRGLTLSLKIMINQHIQNHLDMCTL